MTDTERHAAQRLTETLKTVLRRWGPGFNHLGADLQQAAVRAEMLADIHRVRGMGAADTYRDLTQAMAAAAMHWEPKQ